MAATFATKFAAMKAFAEGILEPTYVLQFGNEGVTPPQGSSWVRGTLLPATSNTVEIGSQKTIRNTGVLAFQCFTPIQQGDAAIWALVDVIVTGYRNNVDSGVRYRTPSATSPTARRDGEWWRVNVNVPYYFDDLDS